MAGRRAGKTELSKRRLVRALRETRPWTDTRYFYGAPTREQAKRIAWDDLKALIPTDWVANISEGELSITTVFGSKLHVFGLDKPQRVEGSPWDGCIIDESSDLHPDTFDKIIYPALADRNGWCWRTGVPKRRGIGAAVYKKAYDQARAGGVPDTEAFHWISADILPAEVIEHARRTLDPKTYREQFEASWETATGLIYDAFEYEHNVRPCLYNPALPIFVACDFNVNPMAWALAHVYGSTNDIKARVEIFDELFLRDVNTPTALTVLYHRYGQHRGGFKFYGDATGRGRRTSATLSDYEHIAGDRRFVALGRTVHFPKGNPACADRYAAVNAKLCNAYGERTLFIDPRCTELIQDFQHVTYRDGTREAEKIGDRSHISDAVGYLIHYHWPIAMEARDASPVTPGQFSVVVA